MRHSKSHQLKKIRELFVVNRCYSYFVTAKPYKYNKSVCVLLYIHSVNIKAQSNAAETQ